MTIIELMIVIAIAGILVAVAAPGMGTLVAKNRVESKQDDLLSSLQYARAEAISRGQIVTVCRSANGAACGGNWSNGWIVFTDQDGDAMVDAGETVLRARNDLGGVGLSAKNSGGAAITNVSFSARGESSSAATLTLCDADNRLIYARAALVFSSGRILRSSTRDADRIHHDINGTNLTCN